MSGAGYCYLNEDVLRRLFGLHETASVDDFWRVLCCLGAPLMSCWLCLPPGLRVLGMSEERDEEGRFVVIVEADDLPRRTRSGGLPRVRLTYHEDGTVTYAVRGQWFADLIAGSTGKAEEPAAEMGEGFHFL